MLKRLVFATSKKEYDVLVLTLIDGGIIKEEMVKHGIKVESVNIRKSNPFSIIIGCIKLILYVNRYKPDALISWMYHCNFLVSLCSLLFNFNCLFFWNIRASLHAFKKEKLSLKLVIWLNKIFSHIPDKIIINSKVSLNQHHAFGFSKTQFELIENGFDSILFNENKLAKNHFREKWSIKENEKIIGVVARWHREKGHELLLKTIQGNKNNLRLVFAGNETDSQKFKDFVSEFGLFEKSIFLGTVSDTSELMPVLDFLAITSETEAFSNVLCESMLCGVIPLVVNVGENRRILMNDQWICERDVIEFSNLISKALLLNSTESEYLSKQYRQSIIKRFSIEAVAKRYTDLLL